MKATRHDCAATVFGPRVHMWQCTRAGVVARNGKWWCRQHDPLALAKRRIIEADSRKAKDRADAAIYAEGKRIARALGVRGDVFYSSRGRFSQHGPTRDLVISFDECLKLIAKAAK